MSSFRRFAYTTLVLGTGAGLGYYFTPTYRPPLPFTPYHRKRATFVDTKENVYWIPQARSETINEMAGIKSNERKPEEKLVDVEGKVLEVVEKVGVKEEESEYDMIVVGGGATGSGVALDAVTRGLKVALLERDDFACGTSSRSTKLVHGGVRYLEKAFWDLDIEQYHLVTEALYERSAFLHIAPYLSEEQPIIVPIYQWWKIPYLWGGAKVYDLLAGGNGLSGSYLLSKTKSIEEFPTISPKGLVAGLVYCDGQHNDSRTNVMLALTAASWGAHVANGVRVDGLLKKNGKINGVRATDIETGKTFEMKAKCVVNATGPFTDGLRQMDDPTVKTIVSPAAGTHVTLPASYGGTKMGFCDPSTSDGRIIFFIPWQGVLVAGTTDVATKVSANPQPTQNEVDWILKELQSHLSVDIDPKDVLSVWSGLRPLVSDPSHESAGGTQNVVRNHLINVSPSGLLTISGGKWTTYRRMAADTVDEAVKSFNLPSKCRAAVSDRVPLLGSANWDRTVPCRLVQQSKGNITNDIAQHLSSSYGDRSHLVLSLAEKQPELYERVHPKYPYLKAEISYAAQYELSRSAIDFIARRTRLAFLDSKAARESIDSVIELMGKVQGWSSSRKSQERSHAVEWLDKNTTIAPSTTTKDPVPTNSEDATIWGGVINKK